MSSAAPNGRGLQLQERDLQIFRSLFEARIMTARQIAAVHFDGSYEAARKRLAKLKAAAYLGERERRPYEQAILHIKKKAYVALSQAGAIADLPRIPWPQVEKRVRVSPMTLQHELEIQDLRAAFTLAAAKNPDLKLIRFSTWPLLHQFSAQAPDGTVTCIKPDAFIHLRHRTNDASSVHAFFVELDRSTEPLATLANRAACYRDHYQRGGFAVRQGKSPQDFAQFPFRVLFVLKTEQRRNHVAAKLLQLQPPILSQVWLTTLAQATADPLEQVWVRPVDYRDAAGPPAATGRAPGVDLGLVDDADVVSRIHRHRLLSDDLISNASPKSDPVSSRSKDGGTNTGTAFPSRQ